jgi:hypothetical protein
LEELAMSKMLSVLVAIFALAIVALPGPADAAQRGADGIRNLDQYEFSSARRQRRVVRRYVGPRYYSQPYYYGPYGYQPYGYQPYGYPYRYYAPAPVPFPFFPFFPFIP